MENLHKEMFKTQANLTVLFFKTWAYHWNVTGDNFYEMHKLLNDQYDSIGESLDRFAEHMRYRRIKPLPELPNITKITMLPPGPASSNSGDIIIRLTADNKLTIDGLQAVIDQAKELNFEDTVNICADIQESLGKNIWMLSAFTK